MKNIIWLLPFVVLAGFVFTIFYEDFSTVTPQEFVDKPVDCTQYAEVKGWVLLSYPIEIHPKSPAVPNGYEAVGKVPFYILDTITVTKGEPERQILGRIQSPWPKEFLVGLWLNYDIKYLKNSCPLPKPKPRDPFDKPSLPELN